MKRFQFRLETVLRVRKRAKEQAQLYLAEATHLWEQERQQLDLVQTSYAMQEMQFREKLKGPVPVEMLKFFRYSYDKLKDQLDQQSLCVRKAEGLRQQRLQELQEAAKQLEAVSQLRQLRWEQHLQAELDAEQKSLDEIGLQRYGKEF